MSHWKRAARADAAGGSRPTVPFAQARLSAYTRQCTRNRRSDDAAPGTATTKAYKARRSGSIRLLCDAPIALATRLPVDGPEQRRVCEP